MRRDSWAARPQGLGFRVLLQATALVLASGAALLGQQEQTGTIYGRITDSRGNPQRLLVELLADGDIPAGEVYTDANGAYAFNALPNGGYWLVAEEEGFEPVRQPVRLDLQINSKMQINVVLEAVHKPPSQPSPIIPGSASSYTLDAHKPSPAFNPRALHEFDKGNSKQRHGDLKAAIAHYQKAIRLDPDLYPALNNLGAALEREGDHAQAERLLLKAVALNPNDGVSYVNLGHALYEEGRYPEAITRLQEGLKRSPSSAAGHFFLGSTYLKLGDLAGAESHLKQACALDPAGMSSAHLQLANVYLHTRNLTAASTELQSYLQANPGDPQAPAIRKFLAGIKAQNN